MTICQRTQEIEQQILSSKAVLSANTKGRQQAEEECPIRTPFQRDRDRIIHCNAYRRLMHKTQVFLSPEGDHYRTRLTHTQEVSQIARTLARALRLNEDLTEAIALGHDLGHTPFGHAGERVLNQLYTPGFAHSLQSVRVVDRLEREGKGLNVCWEVRDGIQHHSTGFGDAATQEGIVVRFSDKIAYLNHDIEDAIRAGILSETDLPWEIKYTLGHTKSQRITTLLTSIIQNSDTQIAMGQEVADAYKILMQFMHAQVYTNPIAKSEENKVKDIVGKLFDYFVKNTDKLPQFYHEIAETEGAQRAVCDYIAGMSDRYCIAVFEDLFVPRSWRAGQ